MASWLFIALGRHLRLRLPVTVALWLCAKLNFPGNIAQNDQCSVSKLRPGWSTNPDEEIVSAAEIPVEFWPVPSPDTGHEAGAPFPWKQLRRRFWRIVTRRSVLMAPGKYHTVAWQMNRGCSTPHLCGEAVDLFCSLPPR